MKKTKLKLKLKKSKSVKGDSYKKRKYSNDYNEFENKRLSTNQGLRNRNIESIQSTLDDGNISNNMI